MALSRFCGRWGMGGAGSVAAMIAGATLLAAWAGRADAAVTLDQQNVFPNPSIGDHSNPGSIIFGQTFTVGLAGTLAQVDVYLSRFPGTVDDLVFQLYNTDVNGLPATQLGTNLTLPPGAVSTTVPDFEVFDVSSFNVSVSPGDVLAFVITANNPNNSFYYILPFSQTQLYGGGSPVQRIGTNPWTPATGVTRDYGFRTYVDVVPEPAWLAPMLAAGTAACDRRRRRGSGVRAV